MSNIVELHKEFYDEYKAALANTPMGEFCSYKFFTFNEFLMSKILEKLDQVYHEIPNPDDLSDMTFRTRERNR